MVAWQYLEGMSSFVAHVYRLLVYLSIFQIAENKHNHIQQMADSSVKHSQVEPQSIPTHKLSRTLSIFSPLSVIIPKREQSTDYKRKNILQSQITQEHSGISCAFKGHQFVLTIERMRMRRLYRCFNLLNKERSEIKLSPICSLNDGEYNHQNKSDIRSKDQLQSLQGKEENCLGIAELPIASVLQSKNTHKFLSKELFQSKLKITALQSKVSCLEVELNEANRRQEKEMLKKRSSLQSLAEEISEKNEVIEELKIMVKSLETKLCLKLKNTAFILEQDSDSLRKSIIHLETVNDKLNFDLSRTKERQKALRQQVKELVTENDRLKEEINRLREELFASDSLKCITASSKRECQLWQSRLRKRELKLAAMERRVNDISRCRITQSYEKISTFWTEKNFTPLQSSNSTQDFLASNKVQYILSFLFHIQNPSYELQSPQLFDQEQKTLLSSHKEKISSMMRGNNLSFSQFPNVVENSQSLNDFGLTVIDLIEKEAVNIELQNKFQQSLKELRFQNERTRLRQQIAELKERQLIVRGVLLNFLKSLELSRSAKKESLNILDLLFECFEYSQDQRVSIFQQKGKKFFGFI